MPRPLVGVRRGVCCGLQHRLGDARDRRRSGRDCRSCLRARARDRRRPAPSCDQADRAHDLARRAEAALEAVMRDEGGLHRMQAGRRRATPSMVRMSAPSRLTASARQELIRRPSTSTVQAPHWPRSQPFLVPVRSSRSRSRSSSVTRGSSKLDVAPHAVHGEADGEVHAGLRSMLWSNAMRCRRRGSAGMSGLALILIYGGILRFQGRGQTENDPEK